MASREVWSPRASTSIRVAVGSSSARSKALRTLRVPITQAATRLMLASKKSSPIDTRSSTPPRTISLAIAWVSSSSSTTWSLSHRTARVTWSNTLST